MGAAVSRGCVFLALTVVTGWLAVAVPPIATVLGPVSLMCAWRATKEFAEAIQVPEQHPILAQMH